MDILSRVPVEIAFQILSKLNIVDIAACQLVSRQWYWITVDQSVWKNIFLERQRAFAIPTQADPTISLSNNTSAELSTSAVAAAEATKIISQQLPLPTVTNWKQKCRTQVISDRNWKNGHIQSLFTLSAHRGPIVRLRIKGSKLLSGDCFGQVAVWDTTTYKCEDLIDAATGTIQLLDFSEAAMVMTVISTTRVCRIWDLQKNILIHSMSATGVSCMTMNDEYLVLGTKNCRIQIIDFLNGKILRSSEPLPDETLYDVYIQNDTLVVATGHFIRILSINTLEILMTSPLPISKNLQTYCSVIHIRSLILLTGSHLLHLEWEPLYKSPNKKFVIDTRRELPPNIAVAPHIHRTKIPPISTITSIAIGGIRPHVLTANADIDRPSLDGTIRVCPPTSEYSTQQSYQQDGDEIIDSIGGSEITSHSKMPTENVGVILTSQIEGISDYLEKCELKPSFMDVDDDVIVIGTNKGDIVVLNMNPQD